MSTFIKVTPIKSVNVNKIKQALLLPIVTPDILGYTLSDDGKWRDDEGDVFYCLHRSDFAIAVADESYIDGLRVEYKIPQGNARYTTIDKWVVCDVTQGDKRLLIIELENECIVEVVNMDKISYSTMQVLKQFGFTS